MGIKLRDYQEACVTAFFKEVQRKRKRHLIILPTGGGKTVVFAHITKQINGQTLILAHRDELIQQAAHKMRMVWPTADIGIIKGAKNETDHQILIGSTQTLANEKRRKAIPRLKFLVIDEAHHGIAPSNQAIINDLVGSETLLLGVTATPNRADGKGLGEIFTDHPDEGPDYERSVLEMISDGYLSPIRAIQGSLKVEMDKVTISHGDYELSSLSKVMNTGHVNKAAFEMWERYAKDRQTIVFAVDINHSIALAQVFRANGYSAAAIHGKMRPTERKEILDQYENGTIQVVVNCQILTEGYDNPSTNCIYLVRPTTSHGLYVQTVGRGLRLYPGKKDCLIIDGVKNSTKHKIVTVAQLFPKKKETVARQSGEEQPGEPDEREEELHIGKAWFEAEESEIYGSEFNWTLGPDGNFRLPLIGGHILLLKTPNGWSPYHITRNQKTLLYDYPLTADYCMGIAESLIKEMKLEKFANKNATWRNQLATQGQIEALKRWGITNPPDTKGAAAQLLDSLILEKELRKEGKMVK